jgi:adenylate cyclase
MKQPVERRLAAILAADVAGYSRLMGADEEGTHERLRALFREAIDPKTKEHRGRIVKNTSDGMLIEFPSVVDAVRCAVAVQGGMAGRNADVPTDGRIELRIGINLGDVIVEDGDIFGDGVNVAARLETLAEPGGICVSRVVWDQVRGQARFRLRGHGRAAGQKHCPTSARLSGPRKGTGKRTIQQRAAVPCAAGQALSCSAPLYQYEY